MQFLLIQVASPGLEISKMLTDVETNSDHCSVNKINNVQKEHI